MINIKFSKQLIIMIVILFSSTAYAQKGTVKQDSAGTFFCDFGGDFLGDCDTTDSLGHKTECNSNSVGSSCEKLSKNTDTGTGTDTGSNGNNGTKGTPSKESPNN